MAEDTLLDAFVDIATRGQAEAAAAIAEFTTEAKRAFGDVAVAQGVSANKGADAATKAAKRASDAVIKEEQRAADAIIREQQKQESARARLIQARIRMEQSAARQRVQIANQFGQAFESAASSFQSGGAEGAIRGITNSLGPLVTGIATVGAQAGKVGAFFGPWGIAIGAALSVALPLLAEWVLGIKAVEEEADKLGDKLQRAASEAEMISGIVVNAHAATRAIRESSDAVQTLVDQLTASDDAAFKLTNTMRLFGESPGVMALNAQVTELIANLNSRELQILPTPDAENDAPGRAQPATDNEALERVRRMRTELEAFNKAQQDVKDSLVTGDINNDAISKSSEALTAAKKSLAELAKNGDLTEDQILGVAEAFSEAEKQTYAFSVAARQINAARGNALVIGLDDALKKEKKISEELAFQHAVNQGLATDADRLLLTMLEQERALAKQNKELLSFTGQDDANGKKLAEANLLTLQLEHEVSLTKEIRALQEKITADKKEAAEREAEAAEKRLQNEKEVAEFAKASSEKIAKSEEALATEKARQAEKSAEKAIQDEIARLGKIPDVKSTRHTLGDIGQTVFGDDDKQSKIDKLQSQLQTLQDKSSREQDAAKIAELEAAVTAAEEDRLKGLLNLSDEHKKVESDLIKAQTTAAVATDKLTAQMGTFEEQLRLNITGAGTTIPGVTNSAGKPIPTSPVRFLEGPPATESAPPPPDGRPPQPTDQEVLNAAAAARQAQIQQEVAAEAVRREAENARREESFNRGPFDGFEDLIRELMPESAGSLEPRIPPPPVEAPPGTQGLEPQWMSSFGSAQAEANARAFEDTDFTSSSLEKLLANSNTLLERVVSGVASIDTQSRFS